MAKVSYLKKRKMYKLVLRWLNLSEGSYLTCCSSCFYSFYRGYERIEFTFDGLSGFLSSSYNGRRLHLVLKNFDEDPCDGVVVYNQVKEGSDAALLLADL